MNKTKVVLLCVFAAISYGIIHDQITAHLCVEYFSLAHPPLFHTDSPTLLAFCWGVFATIGIGAVLGVTLAEVSQSSGPPPYPIPRLARSILILLAVMAVCASLAGLLGFELSRHSIIHLPEGFGGMIPLAKHDLFMAVWFAHGASYLSGLAGGAYLIVSIWNRRGRPRVIALVPRSRGELIRALMICAVGAVIFYLRFIRS
jgi:hypothetical protein